MVAEKVFSKYVQSVDPICLLEVTLLSLEIIKHDETLLANMINILIQTYSDSPPQADPGSQPSIHESFSFQS